MMFTYKIKTNTLSGVPVFYRVEDDVWIPLAEANTDYQEYLAWLAEGNTPEEWSPNGD
jgi:hypothetical protein